MKVCVISSIFPPFSRGGAETVAYSVAQAFALPEHEVFVITCAPFEGRESFAGAWGAMTRSTTNTEHEEPRKPPLDLPLQKGEKEKRIRVFRFTPLNLFTIFNLAKYPPLLRLIWHAIDMINPHTYLVARRILLKEKPDLILTHNLKGLGYTVHLAIHHSRFNKQFVKQRARWFHTLHDLGALHPTGLKIWGREKSLFQNNPLVALYGWINKKLLGDPDVVISPSQFLLNEYWARGFFPKSKTVVVRNPVVESPSPQPSPAGRGGLKQSSSPFGRGPGEGNFRFLFLGQLEPYKGLRLLLEAWREFSVTHKEAELIIAGQGSMQVQVEQEARRLARARYVGFVDREKVWELFGVPPPSGGAPPLGGGRCILVLPSLAYENSPTSIGESFVAGVPVVASRIGGIPELVKDGINGMLFEPGKVEALRQAMGQAIAKWTTLHRGAQESAEQFSIEKYREQIEYLL